VLTLTFARNGPGPVAQEGPFPEIRADAQYMRAGGGKVIARHENHCWYIGADEYFRIDCDGPVTVRFEGPGDERSPDHGPFFHFSSADGIAYGDGEICAHIDVDDCEWYSHRDERYWKEMVVVPAG